MGTFHFGDEMVKAARKKKSILVVGLDPQLRYMPPHMIIQAVRNYGRTLSTVREIFVDFNRAIIDAVADVAIAVKPQMAFYEAYGSFGVQAFESTVSYARSQGLLVIEDAKRGDGGDTADAYADGHIGEIPFFGPMDDLLQLMKREPPLRVDCMTVHGYIGDDCVTRFVKRSKEYGTGIFVVDKTSFVPNSRVEELQTVSGKKVWEELAEMVSLWGEGTEGVSGYRNVGAVLGATKPTDAARMRQILPNCWMLVPGYGGQGGTADGAVLSANQDGLGAAVNSSRGINYAYLKKKKAPPERFANSTRVAALDARSELNNALRKVNKYHF